MMKMKSKEAEPKGPSKSVDETMRAFEQKEQTIEALPEKKAEDIVDLRLAAEDLDKTLPAALALSVEDNPEVKAYLKEKQLPQWHEISHKVERV